MSFSPELAEIRFGCGLSPVIGPAGSPGAVLAGLSAPDTMAARFPIESFSEFRGRVSALRKLRKRMRASPENAALKRQIREMNRQAMRAGLRWYGQTLLRWSRTDQGFRERLVAFWGDHFTARGKGNVIRAATSPYVEDAIRPNISGSFADLLIATTTHPLMLYYLDQNSSVGPGSAVASRKKRIRGLNENLAREVLELHTLGVNGPYTQTDVRQLAELFTGMTIDASSTGFRFRPDFAEPGSETVLGRSYGRDPATLDPVLEALRDLAVHPATARHIAWKLAVHFVSDTPDPALIEHVAARFEQTGGDLTAVYGALLEHPAAWDETLRNVKPPADFIASAARALAVSPDRVAQADAKDLRRVLIAPMRLMGQSWQAPGGPDGWPEPDEAWITPQGVAARLRWALAAPSLLRPDLPDPREFVETALGRFATGAVRFAAASAESRADAIALVLAAPAFQRR